jgi:hypothetical protein
MASQRHTGATRVFKDAVISIIGNHREAGRTSAAVSAFTRGWHGPRRQVSSSGGRASTTARRVGLHCGVEVGTLPIRWGSVAVPTAVHDLKIDRIDAAC